MFLAPLSCLPSAASCALSCLGSLACSAITKGNTSDYRVSKLLAVVLQIMSVSLILIIQSTNTSQWLSKIPGVQECGNDNACYSLQIAYRIGFTTACVSGFHLLLSLLGRCFANKALNSFWVFKFLFVIAGSFLLLMVPNKWFTIWEGFANIALSWFLLIQMVWILNFAYTWNDIWVSNAIEDKSVGRSGAGWYIGLLLFSCLFLGVAYTWYGFLFAELGNEHSNKSILALNVGASTFLGFVSLFCPRGGILPSSVIVLYIAWLSWSTVYSAPGIPPTDTRLIIGLTLAMILLIYSSYQMKLPQVAAGAVKDAVKADTLAIQHVEAPVQESMDFGEKPKEQEDSEVGNWGYITLYNSMHLSAACYLMNLSLSWTNSRIGEQNMIAYWVQAISAWSMLTLYAWTLIAPAICTSRQF